MLPPSGGGMQNLIMLGSTGGCRVAWGATIVTRIGIVLMTLSLLLGAEPVARAQSPLNLGLLAICAGLQEDAQRLQCFDKLVADGLKAPQSQPPKNAVTTTEQEWKITEAKSPVDDTPQMAAVLEADEGNGALIIRCHDRMSDAFLNFKTYVGGNDSLRVISRVGRDAAIDARWQPAKTGDSVFVPTAMLFSFIRSLPDDGDLAVRLFDFQGRTLDLAFKLGPVSEVRDILAAKCGWPSGQQSAAQRPAQTTPGAQPIRRSAKRVTHVSQQAQRWSVTSQRR